MFIDEATIRVKAGDCHETWWESAEVWRSWTASYSATGPDAGKWFAGCTASLEL